MGVCSSSRSGGHLTASSRIARLPAWLSNPARSCAVLPAWPAAKGCSNSNAQPHGGNVQLSRRTFQHHFLLLIEQQTRQQS